MSYLLNWVNDDANETAEFRCVHVNTTQSDEEIARVTIPETMNEVEKVLHILENGLAVQKQAVLERIDAFIKRDRGLLVFTAAVVTSIQRMLPLAHESLQVAAGKSFQRLIANFEFTSHEPLLQLTVHILSVWSASVHEAWLPVFKKLAAKMKKEPIDASIVIDILKLSDINQAKTYRTAACSMISALAPHVSESLSRQLVKKAFDLCQDIEYTVRLRMASELEQLFDIGQTFVQTKLWPELLSLMEDDNAEVKAEASKLLMKALRHLSSSFRREKALPLVIKALSGPYACEAVLPKAGECLQICIRDLEATHQLTKFLDFYRTQLSSAEVSTALAATHNLPGILLILGAHQHEHNSFQQGAPLKSNTSSQTVQRSDEAKKPDGSSLILNEVSACSQTTLIRRPSQADLATDCLLAVVRGRHIECKKLLALAVADIAGVYSPRPELFQIIIDELLDNPETRPVVLARLPSLLSKVELDTTKVYNRLLTLIQSANWRIQFSSLQAVQVLLPRLSQSCLKDTLPDSLITVMKSGAGPTRSKAGEVTAHLIAISASSDLRREIIDRLIQQLAKSTKHLDRQAYLDFCTHAVQYLSRSFFKANFLDSMISLSRDKVSSVRAKFAKLAPELRLGINSEASYALSDVVSLLMEDPDKTVAETACDSHAAMLLPGFWKKLNSDAILKADQVKQETEARILAEEQRSLEEIKKQFVDQLAARAKLEYKANKHKSKIKSRGSVKVVTLGATVKGKSSKRSSLIETRSNSISRPLKKM